MLPDLSSTISMLTGFGLALSAPLPQLPRSACSGQASPIGTSPLVPLLVPPEPPDPPPDVALCVPLPEPPAPPELVLFSVPVVVGTSSSSSSSSLVEQP